MDNLEDLGMHGADRALSNALSHEGKQTNNREKPGILVKNTAPRAVGYNTELRKTGFFTMKRHYSDKRITAT